MHLTIPLIFEGISLVPPIIEGISLVPPIIEGILLEFYDEDIRLVPPSILKASGLFFLLSIN